MKSLKHICEQTENVFKSTWAGMIPGKLYKEIFGWVGEQEIISFNISENNHTLTIAGEDIEDDKEEKRFYLIRAFPSASSGKWHVSVDKNAVTRNELIDYLMKKK